MCEGRDSDEPVVVCSEFEDFDCDSDDDDGTAALPSEAITEFSNAGKFWWDTSASGFAVDFSETKGKLEFDGTVHDVTVSGASMSNSAGDTWTIFKDTVSGKYRVGSGGCSLRFVPASGSPKSRLMLVT